MNIHISCDARDQVAVDGFASATHWDVSSGVSKERWLTQKVAEWVSLIALSGAVRTEVEDQRVAFDSVCLEARRVLVTRMGVLTISGVSEDIEVIDPLAPIDPLGETVVIG